MKTRPALGPKGLIVSCVEFHVPRTSFPIAHSRTDISVLWDTVHCTVGVCIMQIMRGAQLHAKHTCRALYEWLQCTLCSVRYSSIGGRRTGGGGGGGSSAAWPCSYFSSFQPFRSYFHDHCDAKICDARSQILCSTTNFSDNRGIVR